LTYTYTSAARLKTRVWERGVTTTYGYDNAGRQRAGASASDRLKVEEWTRL